MSTQAGRKGGDDKLTIIALTFESPTVVNDPADCANVGAVAASAMARRAREEIIEDPRRKVKVEMKRKKEGMTARMTAGGEWDFRPRFACLFA